MKKFKTLLFSVIIMTGMLPFAMADVYVNVMAVNGGVAHKDTSVKYDLPGDLKAEDILDTNGLQLEYNPNSANYVVSGNVALDPKESKTFRVRIKDIWKLSPEEIAKTKDEINKGFEQIGKPNDPQKAELLKDALTKKLDFIADQQGSKAESIEQRIDASRAYRKEMQRILDQALAVDYWRSEPGEIKEKTIVLKIEVENPKTNTTSKIKQKHYLPSEVKPQHVIDAAGFEVRYDQQKLQPFLYKEEDILLGEKRTYLISILDVWNVLQKDIDYLRSRAETAFGILKLSKFDQSAKSLHDDAIALLAQIEQTQARTTEIKEHIGLFRVNQKNLDAARIDVENLEKLLAIFREDLEKSKVKNVMQKMKSFDGVAGVAKQLFDKKPQPSNTWNYIGYVGIFVAVISVVYFVVLMLRPKTKKEDKVENKA